MFNRSFWRAIAMIAAAGAATFLARSFADSPSSGARRTRSRPATRRQRASKSDNNGDARRAH